MAVGQLEVGSSSLLGYVCMSPVHLSSPAVSIFFLLAIPQATAQVGTTEVDITMSPKVTLWPTKSFPNMRATPLTGSEGLTPTVTGPTTYQVTL